MISHTACPRMNLLSYLQPTTPPVSFSFIFVTSTHKLPKAECYLSTPFSLIFSFQNIKSIYIHLQCSHICSPTISHWDLYSSLLSVLLHHSCSSPFNHHSTFRGIFLNSKPHCVTALLKTLRGSSQLNNEPENLSRSTCPLWTDYVFFFCLTSSLKLYSSRRELFTVLRTCHTVSCLRSWCLLLLLP